MILSNSMDSTVAVRLLVVAMIAITFFASPAAAQSTTDKCKNANSLAAKGGALVQKATTVLPVFGLLVFLYANFRYGTADSSSKSDYKEWRKRSLIYGIIVPLAAGTIISLAADFAGIKLASNACLQSLL